MASLLTRQGLLLGLSTTTAAVIRGSALQHVSCTLVAVPEGAASYAARPLASLCGPEAYHQPSHRHGTSQAPPAKSSPIIAQHSSSLVRSTPSLVDRCCDPRWPRRGKRETLIRLSNSTRPSSKLEPTVGLSTPSPSANGRPVLWCAVLCCASPRHALTHSNPFDRQLPIQVFIVPRTGLRRTFLPLATCALMLSLPPVPPKTLKFRRDERPNDIIHETHRHVAVLYIADQRGKMMSTCLASKAQPLRSSFHRVTGVSLFGLFCC